MANKAKVIKGENGIYFTDNQDRGKLGEGKNYGSGFAFCKVVKNKWHTVQPISPCKDYLNDIVFAEWTGRTIRAYGLSASKKNIFDIKNGRAFMVMSICLMGGRDGTKYNGYETDCKILEENHKNLQAFINWFEEEMKLDSRTEISKIQDNLFAISFPIFWTKGTFLISLFSLLLRAGTYFKHPASKTDANNPLDFLKTMKHNDVCLVNGIMDKVKNILKNNFKPQDLNKMTGGTSVHNTGIVNYKLETAS